MIMREDLETETDLKWSVVKGRIKKILYLIILLLIVLMAFLIYWKYFYTHSEGYRSGVLHKFSHKGNIFTTYEGELFLRSLPAKMNVAVSPEKFNFTVIHKTIAQQLDSMQGQMVIVHYKQKNGKLFWRNNSKYLVDSVRLTP
jgi:hypothetical protein